MNFEEVKALGTWCADAFPQQKWGTGTPVVWAEMLEDYSAVDAKAAAKVLVTRQAFVSLSELITEIKKIRGDRIRAAGPEVLGAGVPADDVPAFLEKVRSDLKAIADGTAEPDREAGELRPVGALIATLANRRAIESVSTSREH